MKENFKKSVELFFFYRIIKVGGDYITFKYRYRKQLIFSVIIAVLLFGISAVFIANYKSPKKEFKNAPLISKKESKSDEKLDQEELLKVDIKGEVAKPGIYSLSSTSRIIDVIEKAGGLTKNANTTVINLSKKITDEMVIIIYSNNQVKDFEKTKEIEKQVQQNCVQPNDNSLKNDACITESTTTPSKISINKASVEDLKTLPGIGEAKAKDIVNYRDENGPFTSIEDLTKITGIGESIFAKIKDYITL